MWLPQPVYEALPTAYVIIGALLLAGAFYVGLNGPTTLLYAGLGMVSILCGVTVHALRKQSRQSRSDES